MGIPAYFMKTIKSYRHIIKPLQKYPDILYMDANSIIYQMYYNLLSDIEQSHSQSIESRIIDGVFNTLISYIDNIAPKEKVYIAFDGVAPFAKMKQQRTRRFKSSYLKHVHQKHDELWNTTAITAGTTFMNSLKGELEKQFKMKSLGIKVIIDSVDQEGEGEQKIFKDIRTLKIEKKIYIYGLDADLIILSLRHIEFQKNIILLREMHKHNTLQQVHISLLYQSILTTMTSSTASLDTTQKNEIIQDYVMLSFFLGNDFMPHFPSLCIRTNGIAILLNTYQKEIFSKGLRFCKNDTIHWSVIKTFVRICSQKEEYFLKKEHEHRNTMITRKYPLFLYREEENMINVFSSNWQKRYYTHLFHSRPTTSYIRQVCINYLEGLQWNYFYYFKDECPAETWYYKYNYPPLLEDLWNYIPDFPCDMLQAYKEQDTIYQSLSPLEKSSLQLHYILPKSAYCCIPKEIRKENVCYDETNIDEPCEFIWAYCTYFWEAHLCFDAPIQKWIRKVETKSNEMKTKSNVKEAN